MKKQVRFFKNPHRNEPEQFKQYVPIYQEKGITPQEVNFSGNASPRMPMIIASRNTDSSPRNRQPGIRQPYAETEEIQSSKGPIPNVGNNLEHNWSSIDDSDLDPNHPMIDNNEFVTDQSLGISRDEFPLSNLEEGEYLLLINNIPLCSGPMEEVQKEAQALIFGEHEGYKESVSLDQLVIIKRIPIKVGLFIS